MRRFRLAAVRLAFAGSLALLGCSFVSAAFAADEQVFEIPSGKAGQRDRFRLPFAADLSACEGLAFDIWVSDVSQYSRFTCFAGTGGKSSNCYAMQMDMPESGKWTPVTVLKTAAYNMEGKVDGWSRVSRLQIAATRLGTGPVTCRVRNLRALPAKGGDAAAVVLIDSAYDHNKTGMVDKMLFRRVSETVRLFASLGFSAYPYSDLDLTNAVPESVKLVVLPCLPKDRFSDRQLDVLKAFVGRGGVILCSSFDKSTRPLRKLNTPTKEAVLSLPRPAKGEDPSRALSDFLLQRVPSVAATVARGRAAYEAKVKAADDWAAAQPSADGEMRIMDCHVPFGSKGACTNWASAVKLLADGGYTHLSVNFCRGPLTSYESKVLPFKLAEYERRGYDALEDCKRECRKHGIRLVAWRCCWSFPDWLTTPAQKAQYLSEGRLQTCADGKPYPTALCPTHPDNVRMEIESLVELAHKGVDTVSLDYIRYANGATCFCDRCRKLFADKYGVTDRDWPSRLKGDPVLAAKWVDFRADNISYVVSNVSARIRRETPGVRIAVAGFTNPTAARKDVGQDWPYWCRQGWIDEVGAMDYCDTAREFAQLIERQKNLPLGKATLRITYGPSCWPNTGEDSRKAAEYLAVIRKAGIKAFACFELDARTERITPILARGPMKR